MSPFLPPDTAWLIRRLAGRNARRARRICRRLGRLETGWRREALRGLSAAASARGEEAVRFLCGPDLRAWLGDAETCLALEAPPVDDRALFGLLARGPHLAEVVPAGRLDRRFRARVRRLSRRLRADLLRRLPLVLAVAGPDAPPAGPFPLTLEEDGEEGRAAGEMLIDTEAPLALRVAGTRLRLELTRTGLAIGGRLRRVAVSPRETIPGSRIVVAGRAVSTPAGLRAGPPVRDAARRLGEALALVERIWPEAHREVLAHTRVVVPLVERGTVSFSLPGRPGVSYINIREKSLHDLADDLIHESAHHRLHGLEEITPLVRDDIEPRYMSAWRRTLRPVRGILHASYTFLWRAELMSRLTRGAGRAPRRWAAGQRTAELAALQGSLAHLDDAARRGLLTRAGLNLHGAMKRRYRRISAAR